MNTVLRGVIPLLVLFAFAEPGYALRCGNSLVDVGDRKHKVMRLCGEPAYTDSYDRPLDGYSYNSGYRHIDVWTYNFGKNRFMQELVFDNGILRRINQLDYGY